MSRSLSLFLPLFVFILVMGGAYGATVTVTTTINAALATLDYGDGQDDVVIVPAGTYDEQLTPKGDVGAGGETAFPDALSITGAQATVDACFASHTDALTIQAEDPGNPPTVTLNATVPSIYTTESNPNGFIDDAWNPIIWFGCNDVTISNIIIGADLTSPHIAGQGSGIVFNDCEFRAISASAPSGGIFGMARNGNWANTANVPDAVNEWTFRNCLFDNRSTATGNVESDEGFMGAWDSYVYPLGPPFIVPGTEQGFLLCESCIFNDIEDEVLSPRGHDDFIWEDGCPHTNLENCMPYNQDKTYADAPRFWTFQDCYFDRNREDELYRPRGMSGDMTFDRCVFNDCTINEGEGFGKIFSIEGRHRSWFVKFAITNSIVANCNPDGGANNHLFSFFGGSGCGGAGNLSNPDPEIHVVNNTIFNTKQIAPNNNIFDVNYCAPGFDPEMAAPDLTPWPDDGDGFGINVLMRMPHIVIANNIVYGTDTVPAGRAFGTGGNPMQDYTDVNLINNVLFALADDTTTNAHSEVGTLRVDPLFASTVLASPANAGDPLPGTPFVPQNTALLDAGDDAAYVASGAGSADVDGDVRPDGTVDIGAQELGTATAISNVENWELMDWNEF